MKWFRKSIGPLSLVHIGETLHTGIGFDTGCGCNISGTSLYITWNGVTKWKIYTEIKHEYRFGREKTS